jgi:succinate dehydrogenase/fumarate reductase cytochrome b subunit
VFVWAFHRASGLLLIVLMVFQLTTGFYQGSYASSDAVRTMADLHRHQVINCVLVFLFIFHSLYGIRTILLDLGVKAEKAIFWGCTALGTVLFAVFLVLFNTLVRP